MLGYEYWLCVCVSVRVLPISNCDITRSRFKVVFKNNMADIRTFEAGRILLWPWNYVRKTGSFCWCNSL